MAFNCFARDIAKRIPRGETENAPAARCSALLRESSFRLRAGLPSLSAVGFSTRKVPFLLPQSIAMKTLALARSLNPFSATTRAATLIDTWLRASSRVQPRSTLLRMAVTPELFLVQPLSFTKERTSRLTTHGTFNARDPRRSALAYVRFARNLEAPTAISYCSLRAH
jgi:hypothetical protein